MAHAPRDGFEGVNLLPHHLGFAVADLDQAMEEVGATFGTGWREPVRGMALQLRTPLGDRTWHLDVVKSTSENGFVVELLKGSPGSTWHVDRGIAFHHFAYAPGNRAVVLHAMIEDGWGLELARQGGAVEASSFHYLGKAGHPRVELCLP